MLVDTHAHLDYDPFDADRDEVIARARAAGVERIVTIGTALPSSRRAIELAERYDGVFAVVGHHPTEAIHWQDGMAADFETLVNHEKVVGVGETGLDYYWKESPPDIQKKVFRFFMNLSASSGKPMIIHVRDAHDDLLAMLEKEHAATGRLFHGVMHCFSGDALFLEKSLDLGFHISFAGNFTYKKSPLPALATRVPKERLLVETDCPFLPPVPHRGQRNEPSYVRFTAQRLAEALGETTEAVAALTTANARRLFGV